MSFFRLFLFFVFVNLEDVGKGRRCVEMMCEDMLLL